MIFINNFSSLLVANSLFTKHPGEDLPEEGSFELKI
jgi:hypothetical protein